MYLPEIEYLYDLVSIVFDIIARNKNELVDQWSDLQAESLTDCLVE